MRGLAFSCRCCYCYIIIAVVIAAVNAIFTEVSLKLPLCFGLRTFSVIRRRLLSCSICLPSSSPDGAFSLCQVPNPLFSKRGRFTRRVPLALDDVPAYGAEHFVAETVRWYYPDRSLDMEITPNEYVSRRVAALH